MKTTALLVLLTAVLGPSSFFGTGTKGKSLDPWQWARADEGQQRQAPPERRPRKEAPFNPSMGPSRQEEVVKEAEKEVVKEDEEQMPEDANDKEWQQVKKSGEQEGSQWLRATAENIAVLAKSVHEQGQKELQVLRQIAEQEQATETVKAIDQLLAIRSERYEQVIEKAKDERRQRMLQKREEKRNRSRERRNSQQSPRRSRTRGPGEGYNTN